jgi:HdeA/HdeB family
VSRFACIVAAMLAASSISASAEEKMIVDMRKMTCAQLTKLGFQDFAGLTMWLSGYYNASRRNMVIDLEQYARAATAVKNACQANPRATVLATTGRALGIKLPR